MQPFPKSIPQEWVTDPGTLLRWDITLGAGSVDYSADRATADYASISNPASGARSVRSVTAGKVYFETLTAGTGWSYALMGICDASVALNDDLENNARAVAIDSSGVINLNGTTPASIGILSQGTIVRWALDLHGLVNPMKLWAARAAGAWNSSTTSSDDPATGVGGLSWDPSSSTAMVAAAAFIATGTAPRSVILRTLEFEFSYPVPAGFTALGHF
jgi:hypothetical protein